MISTLDKLDLEKEAIIDKINGEDVLKKKIFRFRFYSWRSNKMCVSKFR